MRAMKRGSWLLPLGALLSTGCASTPEVRSLAEQTGTFVTSLEQGTGEFIAAQNRLNANNEAILRSLADRAATMRMQVAQQRLASTDAGHQALLKSQALATSVTGADVVASLHPPAAARPVSIKAEGTEGYGQAAKALVEASTKPTMTSVIAGLVTYAEAVRDSHAKLVEDAKKSTDSAGADATAAASNAIQAGAAATPH